MPSTMQDAVTVTRSLGLRYLWIDALCIIQDSKEDKDEQIGRMGGIYGDAIITIAASRASQNNEGFLQKPEFCDFSSCEVKDSSGGVAEICARRLISHDPWAWGLRYKNNHPPLKHRAWTFQEHLLAPRILQFGATEMAWECRSKFCCECNETSGLDAGQLMLRNVFDIDSRPWSDVQQFLEFWSSIVETFTERAIGQDGDRLLALSGIVSSVMERYRSKPLTGANVATLQLHAGHWNLKFLESLCWSALIPRVPIWDKWNAPLESWRRAPSWSWASLEASDGIFITRTRFDYEDEMTAKVVDIDCPAMGFPDRSVGQQQSTGRLNLKAYRMLIETDKDQEIHIDESHTATLWQNDDCAIDFAETPEGTVGAVEGVLLGPYRGTYTFLLCRALPESHNFQRIGFVRVSSIKEDHLLRDHLRKEGKRDIWIH